MTDLNANAIDEVSVGSRLLFSLFIVVLLSFGAYADFRLRTRDTGQRENLTRSARLQLKTSHSVKSSEYALTPATLVCAANSSRLFDNSKLTGTVPRLQVFSS